MKLICCGTQNIGKSTYVRDFLKEWPMYKTPEKTYRDIIKEKGLVINEEGNEESQRIILNTLVDQAIEYSKEDNVILDRCVLDNLVYTAWLNLNDKVSDEFLDETRLIVRETLKMYDILFFIPMSKFNNVDMVEDGLRSVNVEYRTEVDTIFKAFQGSYLAGDGRIFPKEECPAFIEIYGNPIERIKLTSLYIDKTGNFYGEDQSLMSDIVMPPEKQIIVP